MDTNIKIKEEEKILNSKIYDRYYFCKTRNKITNTDFLNISELSIATKFLKNNKVSNYIIFGGKEDSDRKIIIFYPENKFLVDSFQKEYEKILEIVRIKLPKDLKYEHRDYLSGIMKLGIKREKFGDILVYDDGADIISLKTVSMYILDGLKELTRFKKSEITIQNIENLIEVENKFEEVRIIVSSVRLDSFVSEIANCSRAKAVELIENGKVFINYVNELKVSKKPNIEDIITIRGKGKFIFRDIEKTTSKGKFVIKLNKYM